MCKQAVACVVHSSVTVNSLMQITKLKFHLLSSHKTPPCWGFVGCDEGAVCLLGPRLPIFPCYSTLCSRTRLSPTLSMSTPTPPGRGGRTLKALSLFLAPRQQQKWLAWLDNVSQILWLQLRFSLLAWSNLWLFPSEVKTEWNQLMQI